MPYLQHKFFTQSQPGHARVYSKAVLQLALQHGL